MILCCGEALIDMVPSTDEQGRSAFVPLSGGAIFNTAIALGRLDVATGLFSGISNDLFGVQLVEELQASKVKTDLLVRRDNPTTLAFVKLTKGHAEYTFYDENSAGRTLTPTDLPVLENNHAALYFGGISLCAEPGASAYETLFLREAATKVTMLDPNIRTSFIADEAAYRSRLSRMIAAADIVKVSDEDLDWIIPKDNELTEKIAKLHDLGAGLVIMTKGSKGASAYMAGRPSVDVGVPKVTVVDTVGAGDTFNAGFLAKLDQNDCLTKTKMANLSQENIAAALEFAAQVAAVTVSRSGANPPLLSEL